MREKLISELAEFIKLSYFEKNQKKAFEDVTGEKWIDPVTDAHQISRVIARAIGETPFKIYKEAKTLAEKNWGETMEEYGKRFYKTCCYNFEVSNCRK